MDDTDKVIIALGFFSIIGLIIYFTFLSNGGSIIPSSTNNGYVTISELKKMREEMRTNVQ